MGSLSRLIKEKGGELGGERTGQVKVQQIHYTKLKESALNFYTRSDDEVAELADTMLITGGILQPLIVRKTDMSEYEILAGHKRKSASVYNVERGYKEYEFLPCIVIDMSGLMAKKISEKILAEHGDITDDRLLDMIAEYIVICTNSTASESSDYEKMMQAVRLSEILPVMLDNEELKGRALRAEIAREMKCSNGQVGRYQSIYNNLVPEAMERFKDGKIKFSTACSLSGLGKEQQREILKKQQITAADIETVKQEKNTETVSNLDTGETHRTECLNQEDDNETVSMLDTDNKHQITEPSTDDGYETAEDTEENIYCALKCIFDDESSGFPQEVREELLNTVENMGAHVSVLTDIFDKALPFENSRIKIENICGYKIHFKDTRRKMGVALWPFWCCFTDKYKYHMAVSEKPAAVVSEEETDISGDTEKGQSYSISYTQEDVRNLYTDQIKIIQQFEYAMECGGMKDTEIGLYKKALMIRDGMEYLLDNI